jgi:DNA-binding XRE family transcriptional regulator
MKEIQYIRTGNKKTHAVVPIDLFNRLLEAKEDLDDIALYDEAKRNDDGFRIPLEIVTKTILDGKNPVKVWREYRRLTVQALATASGISKAYLSQIENGKRHGTLRVMKAIATALDVPLDILAEEEDLKLTALA